MESFPAFSGRTESRDLICIRHTYQNDKICKTIGLLKSYDNRTKALENRQPPGFLGEKLTGPCLNLLENAIDATSIDIIYSHTDVRFVLSLRFPELCQKTSFVKIAFFIDLHWTIGIDFT